MAGERPQDVVARGYDAGADAFAAWQRQIEGSHRLERVEELLALLPERPDILELGSGAGVSSTRMLAARSKLIGVDISAEQVRRARERVPGARFLHDDLTRVSFETGSFDAVVSFYVFNHVPRDELGPQLGRIQSWLRPGGYLLASFGASDVPAWYGEAIGGLETFFSGYEAPVTLGFVRGAGLEVVRDELETITEPEGDATFLWVLARKAS
ncbi:MAG TPA: methyltransferase domain-containing protein [Gaiellaceae bacterium]|nr:methyltransferase domain-containing protein [Gaiellaceae bacterium]